MTTHRGQDLCHKTLNRGSEGVKKLHTDAQTMLDQVGVLATSAPTTALCLVTTSLGKGTSWSESLFRGAVSGCKYLGEGASISC